MMSVRRLLVHAAAALSVMAAAGVVAALALPADTRFVMHSSGRTGTMAEALLLPPAIALLLAVASLALLRWGRRPSRPAGAEGLVPFGLHLVAFLHLGIVASGFTDAGPLRTVVAATAVIAVIVVAVAITRNRLRRLDD